VGSGTVALGVRDVFTDQHDVAFEVAFAERFGTNPPDELNSAHKLTVIASDVDPATERIVTYLSSGFGVPVNVVPPARFTSRRSSGIRERRLSGDLESWSQWRHRPCSCRWPSLYLRIRRTPRPALRGLRPLATA
jgi:hypothetical protein